MLELVVWMIYLNHQGWSLAEISMLEGVFTVAQVIFEFPSGLISDKIGHKKTLLLGEMLCVVYLLTYFFPRNHMTIYFGFILFALGLAFISGTDISLLYEALSEKEKKYYLKYSSFFNAIAAFSVAFGNILGGWLAQVSWKLLFVLAIIFRITAFIIGFRIKELNTQERIDALSIKIIMKELIFFIRKHKSYIFLVIALVFSTAAVTLSYQYGPVIMKRCSLNTGTISTIFGSLSLFGAIAGLLTYKLTHILSEDRILIILLLFGILLFLSLFIQSTVIILSGIVFVNIIFEMWNIIFENKIQKLAYDSIRATIVSFGNALISGLLALSSFFISFVSDKVSLSWIVGSIGSLFLLIAFASTIFFIIHQK